MIAALHPVKTGMLCLSGAGRSEQNPAYRLTRELFFARAL